MQLFGKVSEAVDFILREVPGEIRLATPLGLGKPNLLLNDLYSRITMDPKRELRIFTALSLAPPQPREELAKRFFGPFAKRQWGDDYPRLQYADDAAADRVPPNVRIHEFYMQAGSALKSRHLQRNYQSLNYTHVAEALFNEELNVIVQLVAQRGDKLSLSCNPDLTLDVIEQFERAGQRLLKIAVVHEELPFLAGEAEVPMEFFDAVVRSPSASHELFALPRQPISREDHLIGFYASQLVRDGGTLQVGIGSLSDAITSSLCLRHKDNARYRRLRDQLQEVSGSHSESFVQGLYGLTEMLCDGFMYLRDAGILKRTVVDEVFGTRTYLHGSFILGSKPLYAWLRKLSTEEAAGLRMTRVSKVNDLYDANELRLRSQRVHARFFNTTMQVTPLGEAMSETLADGTVISGVGGQYNFVAMAHELRDARSILMLRSTRIDASGKVSSNIVWKPGHVTIPRQLRDILITEYGVADLRGKSDEDCIKEVLKITDARFQSSLVEDAKKAGKLAAQYELPESFALNTPANLERITKGEEARAIFGPFPFGSDFTPEEERLAVALAALQEDRKRGLTTLLRKIWSSRKSPHQYETELRRMNLEAPKSLKERFYRRALLAYLES